MAEEPLFDFVMRQIKSSDKPLYVIASESGVSYFTLQKWTRTSGRTKNPRIDAVQKVADYFRHQAA